MLYESMCDSRIGFVGLFSVAVLAALFGANLVIWVRLRSAQNLKISREIQSVPTLTKYLADAEVQNIKKQINAITVARANHQLARLLLKGESNN